MEAWRVQVRLPSSLMAMVQVDQERTGETVASIVRRCIRKELAYTFTDPKYRDVLNDLHAASASADQE